MIFVHRHEHEWVPTTDFIHGERIYRCIRCGDRAFGVKK